MAKYTIVVQEICINCGICPACAPDVFGLDADELAFSLLDNNAGITEIPDVFIEDVMDAFADCPTDAILISDEPFG